MSDTNTARDRLLQGMDPALTIGAQEGLVDAYRAALADEFVELLRQHRGDLGDGHPWWDTRDRDTAIAVLLAVRTADPHASGQLCADPDCGPCSFDRAIPPAEMASRRAARTTTAPTSQES